MSEHPEAGRDPEGIGVGEELVLVVIESSMTRSVLWGGLRHSGFAPSIVTTVEEARVVLEAHGGGGVLLLDAGRLVEEGAAWRGLAEAVPALALVAVIAASPSAFARSWVEELGCACLDAPLDLPRVLEAVRSAARARRSAEGPLGRGARGGPPEGGRGA